MEKEQQEKRQSGLWLVLFNFCALAGAIYLAALQLMDWLRQRDVSSFMWTLLWGSVAVGVVVELVARFWGPRKSKS